MVQGRNREMNCATRYALGGVCCVQGHTGVEESEIADSLKYGVKPVWVSPARFRRMYESLES